MSNFVSPTGYVDLDNDCQYSIDLKSTRSREDIDPKEDLAFYFQTYLIPKYGLDNINVNNVASFMKELEMNWSKITPDLKGKVLDIMIDGIFVNDTCFKSSLLLKLNPQQTSSAPINTVDSKSTFGSFSKSTFGSLSSTNMYIIVFIVFIVIVIFFLKSKSNLSMF